MSEGTQLLGHIALLDGLPPAERDRVAKLCVWRNIGADHQIIDRDSESRDVYFIIEGRVRIVNYAMSGREVSFEDIGPGEFFGELAAIDDRPRSAGVVALRPTTLCVMPPTVFNQLIQEHASVAHQVILRLTKIVRQSTGRIFELSTLGAQNRIQAEILRLARSSPHQDGSASIRPIPVHGDIASRVSTTRETVARVLGDLAREGLIRREREQLVISDLDRLADRVAHFEDS